jgi:serine/threonine protein kinase
MSVEISNCSISVSETILARFVCVCFKHKWFFFAGCSCKLCFLVFVRTRACVCQTLSKGLAKELDPRTKLDDGTYNLTADTGSLRYMAPECALGKPYNETADTFSFSILCWQIFALETPYSGYTVAMFQNKVIKLGTRPKINVEWGETICSVLRESFVGSPKRPSMHEVSELLRDEINKLSDDEIVDVMDASRKSYMSAHGGR